MYEEERRLYCPAIMELKRLQNLLRVNVTKNQRKF